MTSSNAGFTIGHVNIEIAAAQAVDLTLPVRECQWTHDNLDSSQKLVEGGGYTVRGYGMGARVAP